MDTFNEVVASIPENHMDMCKFASRNDVGYKRVSDRIEQLASEAVEAVRKGTKTQPNAEVQGIALGNRLLIEPVEGEQSTTASSSQWYDRAPEIEEPEGN